MRTLINLAFCLMELVVCLSPAAALRQEGSYQVKWVGELRKVMREGDISARISLEFLAGLPHLYAVGPLEGLKGEVTIWDGKPSIATIKQGAIAVDTSFNHKASLLVYAQVRRWRQATITSPINDAAGLERFILRAATEAGVDLSRPFPFLVKAKRGQVKFHIVNKEPNSPFTPDLHDKIKAHFSIEDQPFEIIGFYSDKHHGVLTHHGSNTHMHVKAADNQKSGHVEELRVEVGAIFLPDAGKL